MVQLSLPIVFHAIAFLVCPANPLFATFAFVRTIAVGRILGYRFGSSTSFKLQQVEKRWSNYLFHLFLHAIASWRAQEILSS